MSVTVKELIKTLQEATTQLLKMDQNSTVKHILMPDDGYSGDYEDTFHTIVINKTSDQTVELELKY